MQVCGMAQAVRVIVGNEDRPVGSMYRRYGVEWHRVISGIGFDGSTTWVTAIIP